VHEILAEKDLGIPSRRQEMMQNIYETIAPEGWGIQKPNKEGKLFLD